MYPQTGLDGTLLGVMMSSLEQHAAWGHLITDACGGASREGSDALLIGVHHDLRVRQGRSKTLLLVHGGNETPGVTRTLYPVPSIIPLVGQSPRPLRFGMPGPSEPNT